MVLGVWGVGQTLPCPPSLPWPPGLLGGLCPLPPPSRTPWVPQTGTRTLDTEGSVTARPQRTKSG